MNPSLRAGLIYAAKNGVNAMLTAVPTPVLMPSTFNFSNFRGLEHLFEVMLSAAVARELMVWIPKLLKWSQT